MSEYTATLDTSVIRYGAYVTLKMSVEWWGCDHSMCLATNIPEANGSSACWSVVGAKHFCPAHKNDRRR